MRSMLLFLLLSGIIVGDNKISLVIQSVNLIFALTSAGVSICFMLVGV